MASSTAGIPIIDLAPLESPSRREAEATAAELYEALKKVGFAYIKNHGVPQHTVDEAFEWSRKFFALPQSVKDQAPHPPKGWYHRGYSAMGREKTTQMIFDEGQISESRKVPDNKESFEMGSEANERMPNIWPPEEAIPGFRDFFVRFYAACYGVEMKLLKALAMGMGLPDGYFADYHSEGGNQTRLLHYPPVEERRLREGEIECIGAHSDFGTLTMLFQDEVGGLEVEDAEEKGRFHAAPYVAGTVVVNIGDLLMRWTNDELRSTLHRVRTPPADAADADGWRMTRARFSIPYFVGPDAHRVIDCVPGCSGPGRPKQYAPVVCGDYIDMRMNATY